MNWFVQSCRLGALLAFGGGLAMAAAPGANAADLDYDYPRSGAYKDYWGDREEEPRYSERYDSRCAPRRLVHDRLRAAGWREFEAAQPRGPYVVVDARRRSGRLFRLRIDRCTGEVVVAKPLEPPRRYVRDDWREDRWERGNSDWRDWRRRADGPGSYRYRRDVY
ncbi:MAG: hypothetical protein KDJ47_12115 [Hyphomicrobiaceae bacterium]|nr:hypothetical protein [Hyphomicrobiaceae bacterium]